MHGTGRIRVSTHEAGSWYEIRVADEGPGISPDVREHLFEPFFTTRHRGTGLGLATARRLIDAHGGTVRLECPDRGGTVAIMALPRAQHPQAPLPSDATI
jgi:signal transduction histidine kinase